MCGRFAFFSPREAVSRVFGVELPETFEPRYNVAPSQNVVVIRHSAEGHREATELRWGLVPSWARDPAIGNRMINARAETVAEKPAFRAAFKRRRCAVLADGFYEWQPVARGPKQPHFISRADREPLALAGLWEHWGSGSELLETCTIVTTAANRRMQPIHDRMPVILANDALECWIDPAATAPAELGALLVPCAEDLLVHHPVSRAVNNPRNEGADLIRKP